MQVNRELIPTPSRVGFLFHSFLSALLIFSIAIPPSCAYALRPLQAGNSSGIEENLKIRLGGQEENLPVILEPGTESSANYERLKDGIFSQTGIRAENAGSVADYIQTEIRPSIIAGRTTSLFYPLFEQEGVSVSLYVEGGHYLISIAYDAPYFGESKILPYLKAPDSVRKFLGLDLDEVGELTVETPFLFRDGLLNSALITLERPHAEVVGAAAFLIDLPQRDSPEDVARDLPLALFVAAHFLKEGVRISSGQEESWDEEVWNNLYRIGKMQEGNPARSLMNDLLESPFSEDSPSRIPELWAEMKTTVNRANPSLRQAVNAFTRRNIALVPLAQNVSLLYNRERNEAIFVIGDDARRSQLLAAFLNQPGGSPWEMLSTLHGVVAFTSEGRLMAGLDPLAEKRVDLIHFDPPVEGKGKELVFRINEARFVPVARAVWVVPSEGDQTISGERIRRELGLPNEMMAEIADPLVHLVEQLPRRVFQVPLNTQTPWYQREITTPLTNADFFRAGQEEAVSIQKWVEKEQNISAVQLVDKISGVVKPYQFLEIRRTTVALPDTDEWWAEATARMGRSGLPLLLGMKQLPNELGNRDFGVFISLVMKEQTVTKEQTVIRDQRVVNEQRVINEQTLFIYQISDFPKPVLIGQISRGQKIVAGTFLDGAETPGVEQAKIVEKTKVGVSNGLTSKEHLEIEWTADGNILVTDRSKNGTWLNADLAQKLFPAISFAEKTVSTDRPLVNLADWAPSATVLEQLVSRGGVTVPMLQISGGKDRADTLGKQIRLPGDTGWWETVRETTQGVRVLPGILGVQENVFPQKAGPVLILRREKDRIQVHQVVPNADPQNREPIIGSVGPGEILVFGRAPPEAQNGKGAIVSTGGGDPVVSRKHFSIRWEIDEFSQPQGIIFGDEGSTNGTFLFQREIAEIAQAVDRKAAVPPVVGRGNPSLVEVVLGEQGGEFKVVVPLLDNLLALGKKLGIKINRDDAVELYDGKTIVTEQGERYYLAVLPTEPTPLEKLPEPAVEIGIISPDAAAVIKDKHRREPSSPEEILKPTLYVEAGIISPDILRVLGSRYEVVESQSSDAPRIIAAARLLQTDDQTVEPLKPVLIITPGSALDQSVRASLAGEPNEGWNLPLAMVSVPRELLDRLTANNILGYLLDLISRADNLPGRTDEQIRAFEERGRETWLLVQRA